MRRHRFLKPLFVLVMLAGSLTATATPAMASPSGCGSGISSNVVGGARFWYAWGNCTSGSGNFQVTAVCYVFSPTPEFYPSAVHHVGQGEVRVACPSHIKPASQWLTTWS